MVRPPARSIHVIMGPPDCDSTKDVLETIRENGLDPIPHIQGGKFAKRVEATVAEKTATGVLLQGPQKYPYVCVCEDGENVIADANDPDHLKLKTLIDIADRRI